ncbi:ISAs1 family transposase [Prochlorothrix hollandica]|uniref:Transposase n=1 Tax=Prochlorothrix hollandica PCC 9006 = CALU 1027 TaxID=317619 RepID=A0A0M2PVL2_PROHO|nr:ISAs1 family transposase [Prochlorothrix hollandica]KKI98718.1 transposase [Prochlorothrix hollandica PCC 9006 = CALU 1027]
MAKGFGPRTLNPQQAREAKILSRSVLQYFQNLPDPRVERTRHHSLSTIITIAILAVLAGADGFVAIERYGRAKQSWLETFLDLPHGIPSHDTFGRVIGALDPQALAASFLDWVTGVSERLGLDMIHIDGKTARGSYDREGKLKALHSVSAWSSDHRLVLAQQRVDSKSNEITAVPLLLKLLNLKGAVVTLDAMGTQTAIARQIRQGGGDYVLALKGNQGTLSRAVETWFKQTEVDGWDGIDYDYHETLEAAHHRLEIRQVWTLPVSELPSLPRQSQWVDLNTVVMVRSTRHLWNKITTEVRFYISSLPSNAARHDQVVRSHWSVENSLHWVLDVTFNEDASRIRQGYGAENFGLLRRLCVSLLNREPSKLSLKMKRYTAALDNDFLLKILAASAVDEVLPKEGVLSEKTDY